MSAPTPAPASPKSKRIAALKDAYKHLTEAREALCTAQLQAKYGTDELEFINDIDELLSSDKGESGLLAWIDYLEGAAS